MLMWSRLVLRGSLGSEDEAVCKIQVASVRGVGFVRSHSKVGRHLRAFFQKNLIRFLCGASVGSCLDPSVGTSWEHCWRKDSISSGVTIDLVD